MKKLFFITLLIVTFIGNAVSQIDTISSNIYQHNNKLGIGTTEPFTWLSVINDTNYIDWNIETSIAEFKRKYDHSTARFLIYGYPNTDLVLPHVRKSVMLYATGDAKDLILCASQPEGRIRFFTQTWANPNSERMVIDSSGYVGIGTTEPRTMLSVTNDKYFINQNTNTSIAEFRRTYDNSEARFLIYGYPNTDLVLPHVKKSVMLYATGDAKDLIICASQPEGRIRFFTQTWANSSSERMVIDSGGFVGIGTTETYARLQIADGDIYISDVEKGIIMKSPDGNCWRGTLDNSGSLIFEPMDCPEYTMVSVQDWKSSNQVIIYPNPTEGKLTITTSDDYDGKKMKYSIYNINGSVVEHGKLSNDNEVIDISGYSSGIYLIKVFAKNGDLVSSNKIIKN